MRSQGSHFAIFTNYFVQRRIRSERRTASIRTRLFRRPISRWTVALTYILDRFWVEATSTTCQLHSSTEILCENFHFYRILKTNFQTFLLLSLKSVILIRFNSDFPIFLALKRSEKVAQRSVCYWTAATSMCILIISALSLFFSAEPNEKSVIALSSKRGNTLLCSTKAGCIWWRTAFNNVALGCAEQWK